ncbi:hypothetical protein ACGFY7_04775 [Streptomyces prunicolor]|uniref:hypothetical protein n=1 Tax=Streptomyces prunicolor TaxID=67348 RepID=UPI00371C87F0
MPSRTGAELRRPTNRRCTTAALDLVNAPDLDRAGSDDTAVTRIPEAGPTASTGPTGPTGPPGTTAATEAVPRAPASTDPLRARGTARCTTAPDTPLALARNGTVAGAPCCGANARPGKGSSPAGRPRLGTARTGAAGSEEPAIRALRSASSTARNPVPVKDGFCHVGRRAPNPASATPVPPTAEARWIGGNPGQAARATAGAVAPLAPVVPEVPEELTGPAESSSSAEP